MAIFQLLPSYAVKAIEQRYAATTGAGNCYALMEKAGSAVVRELLRVKPQLQSVWVMVGKGNNGGDGYVVARLLQEKGIKVLVFAVGLPHAGTEAAMAYERFAATGGEVYYHLPGPQEPSPEVVIDALLGTGIDKAPHAPVDAWIEFINTLPCFKLAVDVPSGLNADSGNVPGACVQADLTVCMLAFKPGIFTGAGVDYSSKVSLDDLGVSFIPKLAAGDLSTLLYTYEDIKSLLPRRKLSAHKGDAGRVLIIGGALGFGGAAIMAGQAALRAGAGLIKVACHHANIPALNAASPELMTVDFDDAKAVQEALSWADVVAIGPGLGQSVPALNLLTQALNSDKALVVDADALNLIAAHELTFKDERHLITPHPGEAARLLKTTVAAISAARVQSAKALQQQYGGVVLLKGAGSVICDGRHCAIAHEGSPAMASGGMGDILTGLCAAYVAQGLSLDDAMLSAVAVHGRAGFMAGKEGVIGTKATDLLPFIRTLTNRL